MGIGLQRIRNENCLKTMVEKMEFRGVGSQFGAQA